MGAALKNTVFRRVARLQTTCRQGRMPWPYGAWLGLSSRIDKEGLLSDCACRRVSCARGFLKRGLRTPPSTVSRACFDELKDSVRKPALKNREEQTSANIGGLGGFRFQRGANRNPASPMDRAAAFLLRRSGFFRAAKAFSGRSKPLPLSHQRGTVFCLKTMLSDRVSLTFMGKSGLKWGVVGQMTSWRSWLNST